tara:strand:- start:841 stop:1548 length:708 start_codon:yes stop_codon:yes gene_type:complete
MNENLKTYKFVLSLAIVCALLLSLTNSNLKEKQKYNIEVDRQKNVLKCAGFDVASLSSEDIVENYNSSIIEKVLSLNGDEFDIKINDLNVLENKVTGQLNYYYENNEYLPLYIYENKGMIQNYILPISGKGLWSTLFGFVSLSNDFRLVKGITFFQHAETPGLGGEVDNPNFQNQFIDKKIFDKNNDFVSVKVVKPGMAKGDHQVDGLSGATITSNGLSNFLKEDLNRYRSFFKI